MTDLIVWCVWPMGYMTHKNDKTGKYSSSINPKNQCKIQLLLLISDILKMCGTLPTNLKLKNGISLKGGT